MPEHLQAQHQPGKDAAEAAMAKALDGIDRVMPAFKEAFTVAA